MYITKFRFIIYININSQTKHIENQLYKKPKMTTALAIKCKDGIVFH